MHITLVQKRNFAIITSLGCISISILLVVFNIRQVDPSEPLLCGGGFCWDLFTHLDITGITLLASVAIGVSSGIVAFRYHRMASL